jgi:putative endonuclease
MLEKNAQTRCSLACIPNNPYQKNLVDGVFVEVRLRHSEKFGSPAETVDLAKQRKILRTATHYLSKHNDYTNLPVRFDVVAVTQRNYRPKILWIRDAFQ